jgi:hypothetical protein
MVQSVNMLQVEPPDKLLELLEPDPKEMIELWEHPRLAAPRA